MFRARPGRPQQARTRATPREDLSARIREYEAHDRIVRYRAAIGNLMHEFTYEQIRPVLGTKVIQDLDWIVRVYAEPLTVVRKAALRERVLLALQSANLPEAAVPLYETILRRRGAL